MADLEKNVSEVIEDLKKKISNLANTNVEADEQAMQKINEIKQKAITVLSQASNKIVETANSISDSEEIQKGIDIVTVKSKELYENAINKINELSSSDTVKQVKEEIETDVKQTIDEVKNSVEDFFEKDEVKDVIETVKEKTDDITEKALGTLKEWLKPEDK